MGFSDLYEISYDTARIGMHATLGCMEGVNFLIHTETIHKWVWLVPGCQAIFSFDVKWSRVQ